MKRFILFCFFALFLINCHALPGIKATVTQSLLNYGTQVGTQVILQDLSSINIPDVSGVKHIDLVGDVTYNLTNIKLDSLTLPNDSVTIIPNSGLKLGFVGSTSHVTFNWRYSLWLASDSGTADVYISDTDIIVAISITNQNGHPYLKATQDYINLGRFKLVLHGGASWLYDLFIDLFNGDIRKSIQTSINTALIGAIDNNANTVLQRFPTYQDVGCCSYLSYALTQNPRFSTDFFTADLEGQFYDKQKPTPTPFPISALPDKLDNQMLQLFISDFMITSGAYAYWQAGELDFFITPGMVPTTSPIQLNTTYFNDLIPQLYSRYPGRLMDLNVTVAAMPTVNFNASGALVNAVTHVDFLVQIGNTSVYCFTLEITLHLTGDAHLNGTKIYGDVSYVYADVTLYRTAIGNFSVSNLEDVVQLVVSVGLPIINGKLAEGFSLPIVDGVELVNPAIKFGTHFLAVTTNAKYTPPQPNNVFPPNF